jgi:hypothetical protein
MPLTSPRLITLRGVFLLRAASAGLAAAPLSTTWQAYVDAGVSGEEAVLADFSYAGYRRSEVPLPDVAGPVFEVTAFGARPDDNRSDRDAIQAAIDAAAAAGGGVVFFPPGRFHLNTWKEPGEPLRIRTSGIVLRGSGAWPGGTELFMEAPLEPLDPEKFYSTPEILLIQPELTATVHRAEVTALARRGSFRLAVSDPGNFAVGDWITLQLDDPAAVASALAPRTAAPEWTRLTEDGLSVRERHQVAAIEGDTLVLAEPLHLDVDPAYAWSVRTYPHLEEIGIEDLAFRGNWMGAFKHHRSALDDSAWSCLQVNQVVNGWIRRCRFLHWNEVVNLHDSSFFTVLHTRIEGNPGHFGIHTRRGNGVLIALGADLAGQWHGPSVGYQSAGTVFWRYHYPADSSFDAHGSGPYATLLDANRGGLLRGRTGGPLEAQPNHLRGFTLWNFEHLGPPLFQYDFWAEDATTRDRFLFPVVVGFHGTASSFEEDDLAVAESIGAPVAPASLFEAQLARRLGGLPAFLSAWQDEWTSWEARPAETVARVRSASELTAALATAQPGTRLVLAPGIYRNQSLRLDGTLTPTGGGTADWPIVLAAEKAGEVVLIGNSELRFGGRHMVAEGLLFAKGSRSGSGAVVEFQINSGKQAEDCLLRNSAIVAFNPPDPATDYDWISLRGQRNRVEHCAFTGMNHRGVQLVVWLEAGRIPNGSVIRGNLFADRAPGTGNGFETIRLGTSDTSLLRAEVRVEGNLFERCDGEIEIISNKSVGNVFRGNTFRANNGQLTLRHGAACLVDANFFLGEFRSGSSGVRIIGPDHVVTNNYFAQLRGNSGLRGAITLMNGVPDSPLNRYEPLTGVLVAHNTIIDCDAPFIIGAVSSEGDTTVPPADSILAHNVVSGSARPHVRFVTPPTGFLYVGHLHFGAPSGLPEGTVVLTEHPRLALAADGLYRPEPSSPLLGAAADAIAPSVVTDLDGQPRSPTGRDLGADEVSDAPRRLAPLSRADVGPSWPVVVPEIAEPGEDGLVEPFSYASGVLRGQGFWSDSAITASRAAENTDALRVESQALHLDFLGGHAVGTLFTPVFAGESRPNGSLYASLRLRVEALPATPANDYFAAFSSADGNTLRGRLWIVEADPAASTYRLGVTSKTGSPFAVVPHRPLHLGETYSLLLEHTYDANSTLTRLYVDASAAVDPSVVEISTGGSPLNGFAFRSGGTAVGSLVLDQLRVSDDFDAALNPLRDPWGGVRFPDRRWYWHPSLGWYFRHPAGHVYDPRLGWMWFLPPGADPDHLYLYDFTTGFWWFTALSYHPWVYCFGPTPGWFYIEPDSLPGARHLSPPPS